MAKNKQGYEILTIIKIGEIKLDQPMALVNPAAKGRNFEFQKNDGTSYMKKRGNTFTFEHDFYLCAYQCAQEFWHAVIKTAEIKSLNPNPSLFKGKTRPVERVSWGDIQIFLEELNKLLKEKKIIYENKQRTPDGFQFQLPAEVEWEFAARGTSDMVYAGSDVLEDVGWYGRNSNGQTMPVGLKQPNKFGLYDMSGNVREWCRNNYTGSRSLKLGKGENWTARRGGSYSDYAQFCRVRNRIGDYPDNQLDDLGFRFGLFPVSLTE